MNGEQIWDKFEDMREVMGDADLLIALADSLGTYKLLSELLYTLTSLVRFFWSENHNRRGTEKCSTRSSTRPC